MSLSGVDDDIILHFNTLCVFLLGPSFRVGGVIGSSPDFGFGKDVLPLVCSSLWDQNVLSCSDLSGLTPLFFLKFLKAFEGVAQLTG